MQNDLQLNPDKSESLIVGTSPQLKQVIPVVPFVTVAGVDRQVAEQMKVLGGVLDQRLTFEKHVTAVAKSCNYHAQAIRHIRHLLTLDLAQTLAYDYMPTSALDPESAGRRSSRILFAVNCSPVGDVIAGHGVQYHQYADDTQLHLAMRADNTAAGLPVLAACTSDVQNQNRLLQCSVAWCPSRDDPQAATSAEQCGSDCS